MKNISAGKIAKVVSAYFMLLLILLTILPFNLFHHHPSKNVVCCEDISCVAINDPGQNQEITLKELTNISPIVNCLFCSWQMNAKLTYVFAERGVFLPASVKNSFAEFHMVTVDIIAFEHIPNKGPPSFLLV